MKFPRTFRRLTVLVMAAVASLSFSVLSTSTSSAVTTPAVPTASTTMSWGESLLCGSYNPLYGEPRRCDGFAGFGPDSAGVSIPHYIHYHNCVNGLNNGVNGNYIVPGTYSTGNGAGNPYDVCTMKYGVKFKSHYDAISNNLTVNYPPTTNPVTVLFTGGQTVATGDLDLGCKLPAQPNSAVKCNTWPTAVPATGTWSFNGTALVDTYSWTPPVPFTEKATGTYRGSVEYVRVFNSDCSAGSTKCITSTLYMPLTSSATWSTPDTITFAPPAPQLTVAATPITAAAPAAITLTGGLTAASGEVRSWDWNFGDGTSTSVPNSAASPKSNVVKHVYVSPGVYTVTLTGANGVAVGNPAKITVTVTNVAPAASFSATQTSTPGLIPAAMSFQDTSICPGCKNRVWNFGDGTTAAATNPSAASQPAVTHTYARPGNYTVTLSVSNDNPLSPSIASNKMTISAATPTASFTVAGTNNFFAPSTLTFSDTTNCAPLTCTTRQWSISDTASGTTRTATTAAASYSFASPTVVTATLRVFNGYNWSAPASQIVSINPMATTNPALSVTCPASGVELFTASCTAFMPSTSATTAPNISWTLASSSGVVGTTSGPSSLVLGSYQAISVFSNLTAGTYTVTVSAPGAKSASASITVATAPTPTVSPTPVTSPTPAPSTQLPGPIGGGSTLHPA